jgi:hypothetical protein
MQKGGFFMDKKKVLSLFCAGIFSLSLTAPVLDFIPTAQQSVAEAAGSYICSKCQRTTTTKLGSPSPGNCPKGGLHNWVYRGNVQENNNTTPEKVSVHMIVKPSPESVLRIKGNNAKKNARDAGVVIRNGGKTNVKLTLDTGFFRPTSNSFYSGKGILMPGGVLTFVVKPGNGRKDIRINRVGNKAAEVAVTMYGDKNGGFELKKIR